MADRVAGESTDDRAADRGIIAESDIASAADGVAVVLHHDRGDGRADEHAGDPAAELGAGRLGAVALEFELVTAAKAMATAWLESVKVRR